MGPSVPVLELAQLGIQHEQHRRGHLSMVIKHVLSRNPVRPVFDAIPAPEQGVPGARSWTTYGGGNCDIGCGGERSVWA